MARGRVTLGDVARRAGVSTTTVSYVLNGRGQEMRIAPDTESKVRRAIDDLGFRPSRLARNLRTEHTRTIGVVTDFVASGLYSSHMLRGAGQVAAEHDYLLVIVETGNDPGVERLLVEELTDRHVDFFLFATLTTRQFSLPHEVDPSRAVLLNCVDTMGRASSVVPDEYAGGRRAAEAVLDRGVRTGVWLVGDPQELFALAGPLRTSGLADRLAEDGVELSGVVSCPWDVVPAREHVSRWLATGPEVAVIVALNDRIAMGVYQALGSAGLSPGAEVGVVSFDGSELATWLRPALASVEIPYAEMGATAIRHLFTPGGTAGESLRVPMRLMAGDSI